MVVLGIARQAFEVYRGLRREAAADALGITGPILLRSLADAAILLRWIQDNPPLRVEMYFAEDDRQLLAVAPELVDGDDELRRAQVACKARAKSWRGPRGRSR
jgi:hypothetical protein